MYQPIVLTWLMKNTIGCCTPGSCSSKTGWCTIQVFLISTVFATITLAQAPKEGRKTVVTGVVSDAVNGMLIDSVSVSADGVTTRSNAQGVFTLVIPAKKSAMPNDYVLTFAINA